MKTVGVGLKAKRVTVNKHKGKGHPGGSEVISLSFPQARQSWHAKCTAGSGPLAGATRQRSFL